MSILGLVGLFVIRLQFEVVWAFLLQIRILNILMPLFKKVIRDCAKKPPIDLEKLLSFVCCCPG